jgi:hypothetical protein
MFGVSLRREPRNPAREVAIDVDVLREIVIDVLLEHCSDPRASALTLEEIEAKNVAGHIREIVLVRGRLKSRLRTLREKLGEWIAGREFD